jgi:asparagine synthase (glutamine-hydrolysing)
MVSDVPVGAFLSGGLDSSSVVTFARELAGPQGLQCFTIAFKDASFRREGLMDDLPYARRVAAHLGVDLNVVTVGPEMAEQFTKAVYHVEEPQADPATVNVLFITELARQHGMKVLLSGTGGDDIFSGYRRHTALARESLWGWLPKPLRASMRVGATHVGTSSAFGRRLAKAGRYADLDGDERIISYFYWTPPEAVRRLYGPALRERTGMFSPSAPMREALRRLPRNTPAMNRMLYLDGKFFLTDHNLNYTDKMAMANGVEVRVPLLDPDLVAFAARLPVRFKQRNGVGKWIFKRAMEPFLPKDIVYRPKVGFGAPLRHWLRHELRPLVMDVLSEATLTRRGLFDPKQVHALIEQDRAGRIDGAYTIFTLLWIELWCRSFLDESTGSMQPVALGSRSQEAS